MQLNCLGETCPIPLIKAKKAIAEMQKAEDLEVLVDNEIAVQNLQKLAASYPYEVVCEQKEKNVYAVTIRVSELKAETQANADVVEEAVVCAPVLPREEKTVVVISSKTMGDGDEALGAILIKGFIFALTQMEKLPDTVLFYNGGAYLTTEGSASLADLKTLEAAGVKILTCGTCLNHYGLSDKLQVGEVTNMYVIVETMMKADKVLRP